MKHIKNFKLFEKVIIPEKIESELPINSYDTLVGYGEQNNFDVVEYGEFFDSLDSVDQESAPPKGVPFFALYHPIRKKPMFVVNDQNVPKFIPNFKTIVDDVMGHERIHGEQIDRRGGIEFNLPDPTDTKEYFSNKEEIMAFSWSIANGLAKKNDNIKDAFNELNKRGYTEHNRLWDTIKRYCDEKVKNRYRKYIYLYLEEIFLRRK